MKKARQYFKVKIADPLIAFLVQGVSPKKLALSVTLGTLIGLFPVLGTHTPLCLLVIFILRLNPAALFLVSNLVFPIYFFTLLPLISLGEKLLMASNSDISIEHLYLLSKENIWQAIQYLGLSMGYAIVGWIVSSIPLSFIIYAIFVTLFKKAASKMPLKYNTTNIN